MSARRHHHRCALLSGSLLGAIGVALGAFGAHGLRHLLTPDQLGVWHTAVEYQMWHAVALLALGAGRVHVARLPVALLTLGVLLFSGSLYLLTLTGIRALGIITPLGGLCMMAAWVALAYQAWRSGSETPGRAPEGNDRSPPLV